LKAPRQLSDSRATEPGFGTWHPDAAGGMFGAHLVFVSFPLSVIDHEPTGAVKETPLRVCLDCIGKRP
jgi:hypothetical protein